MINPESINLTALPNIFLWNRAMLPSVTCIYFVIASDNRIL